MIHEVTPPYSLESNEVAEIKNMTLKEMMNSFLVSASTFDNLWGKAILSACHLQNKFHTRKLVGHLLSCGNVTHP